MKRSVLLASAFAGGLFVALASVAQADDQMTADNQAQTGNSSAETVIVTGTRLKQDSVPMKAAYTESTIDEETILNFSPSPGDTVQTLLNTQPSIYAVTGGPNGVQTDIKFRAFSDGEFGETFAGIPLNDIFNSGVTGQASVTNNNLFIPRDLEAVQVYRGVNNPSVNTYNSLGGTINFVPRQPTEDMNGDLGVSGGSFGGLDYHATFNTGDWSGIKQTVTFERDYSSGWMQNTPDWNDNLYYAGRGDLENTELFAYFVYNHNRGDVANGVPVDVIEANGWDYQWPLSINLVTNDDTHLVGIVGFKSEIAGVLTVEDEAYTGKDDFDRVGFSNYQYTGPYWLQYEGEKSWYLSNLANAFPLVGPGQAYGNTLKAGKHYAYAATDYHNYGYEAYLYGDRVQAVLDLPFNKITAGGDFNVGELHSREYLYGSYEMPMIDGYNDWWDEHDTRQMWSAYIQDDIYLLDDRIHVTPGLKYIGAVSKDNDALGYYYDPPGSIRDDNHFLSPTVGASFEATPDFTLYASFGKNVKFPDIDALYNELGYSTNNPSPIVQPEYALDYEAGVRYKQNGFQAEVNVYREDFSHIIYYVYLADGAQFYQNGGSERYQGVELQLNDDFGEFWHGNWKGYLNASYNQAVCTSVTESDDTGVSGKCETGEALANVPDYLVSAGLTWDHDGWHVDLKGQYVGPQFLENYSTGLPEASSALAPGEIAKIPDYFVFDVGIVKVVPIALGPANALRFGLNIDNLFDKHYYAEMFAHYTNNPGDSTYGTVGQPRAIFGSMSVYF